MIWLFGLLAFYYGIHLAIGLIGYVLCLIGNGFNFRKTSRELEFEMGLIQERKARKKLDAKRSQEEYLAKKTERGY